jgi:hypothetical protein
MPPGAQLCRGLRCRVLDLSSLDLGEIAAALADRTDYEHRWLINPETGEVAYWTSDTGRMTCLIIGRWHQIDSVPQPA